LLAGPLPMGLTVACIKRLPPEGYRCDLLEGR